MNRARELRIGRPTFRNRDPDGEIRMVLMADVADPKSVGPRIRMMRPHLTPLEAKVVDTVMGRRDFSVDTALKEIADEAGVSEAMVIKIAKKLGFSGYRDFRQNVADYVKLSVDAMHEEL